jgi:hypothetical protein
MNTPHNSLIDKVKNPDRNFTKDYWLFENPISLFKQRDSTDDSEVEEPKQNKVIEDFFKRLRQEALESGAPKPAREVIISNKRKIRIHKYTPDSILEIH